MKKTSSFVLSLMLATGISAFAAQTTVTGVLTDDMCTKKHMMPGKTNADCVRECLKHGAKLVLVSKGKVLELRGSEESLKELAGKRVTLTGEAKGQVFVVTGAAVAQ
ncbi:MAG TPA: hypothetical protein VD837_11460 [Terriglobales bacterium]|nr:hypothetical protein [Terriglobales bacterium]